MGEHVAVQLLMLLHIYFSNSSSPRGPCNLFLHVSELQHNLFTGPQIYLTPLHTDCKKKRKEENCLGKKVCSWFLLGLIIVICKNTFLDRNAAVCCKKLALGGSQDFWLMLGLTVRQRSMAQPTNHLSTFVHCLFKVSAHICVLCLLFLWQESCGAAEWCSLPITSQSRWRKISQEPSLPTLGSSLPLLLQFASSDCLLFLPSGLSSLHYTGFTWLSPI